MAALVIRQAFEKHMLCTDCVHDSVHDSVPNLPDISVHDNSMDIITLWFVVAWHRQKCSSFAWSNEQ